MKNMFKLVLFHEMLLHLVEFCATLLIVFHRGLLYFLEKSEARRQFEKVLLVSWIALSVLPPTLAPVLLFTGFRMNCTENIVHFVYCYSYALNSFNVTRPKLLS